MSTTLLSAMTAALLTATCLTALADPPKKHNRTTNVDEPAAFQTSASTASEDGYSADGSSGVIQAVGRTGSHSMHPTAPVASEQFADDDTKVQIQTGDQ